MKFVITRQVVTIVGASVATALLLGAGCEDPAARQRTATQQIIAEAGRELEIASLSAWDPGDESATQQRIRLDKITKKLRDVKAEGGQQVATAMLSSAAYRELARISLSQAESLESQNRDLYEALHSNVDAALRLQGLADGMEGMSTSELRAMLDVERRKAEEELRNYSQRVAELDGPITEREAENEHDAREASRLEDEAIALRRQAAEWGHAAGLSTFEQAISLEREADGYEYQIAWRESDLQYDLRPEHELAGEHVAYLSDKIKEIHGSDKSLRARDELGAREVATTRSLVRQYRDQIADGLEAARERTRTELQEHYTQAQNHLEQAVTHAKTATTRSVRGQEDAARLTLVRAYERQGKLFATRGRGLGAHAAVLDRIIEAGGAIGDPDGLRRELTEVRASENRAFEQARAQLASAIDYLEKVKSKTNQVEVDAFKRGLSETIDSLVASTGSDASAPTSSDRRETGRSSTSTTSTPNSTSTSTSTHGTAAVESGSYETAEDLLAMLLATDPADATSMLRMLDVVHASTPESTRLLDMQRTLIGPQKELFSAMSDHFGGDPSEMLAGMGGASIDLSGEAEIIDQTADRATVQSPGAPPLELVKIDGSWKVDGDTMFAPVVAAGLPQVEMMMGAMPAVFGDLAERVRAGDFSAPEQVVQAMMSELMGAMGGATSGGARMPGK